MAICQGHHVATYPTCIQARDYRARVWQPLVPETSLSGSLISIVDDDKSVRESMRRLMRSRGFPVEAFPSAADFLGSPRLGETACLIADVQMPTMNGDELYRRLRRAGYTIPTILVTAYPDDVVRARALNDGVICYLLKPLDEARLITCIRTAIGFREPPHECS
jgi:FixJ family two-component response regulator